MRSVQFHRICISSLKSLTPVRCGNNFKSVILEHMARIIFICLVKTLTVNTTKHLWLLVNIAWLGSVSQRLIQWWPRSLSSCNPTMPQLFNQISRYLTAISSKCSQQMMLGFPMCLTLFYYFCHRTVCNCTQVYRSLLVASVPILVYKHFANLCIWPFYSNILQNWWITVQITISNNIRKDYISMRTTCIRCLKYNTITGKVRQSFTIIFFIM